MNDIKEASIFLVDI